jgi:hypothetical protein
MISRGNLHIAAERDHHGRDRRRHHLLHPSNGTAPTTASTKYTGPIPVAATETIQAIAVAAGHAPSALGKAAYTIK